MKFIMFLIKTPKASLSALIVAVAQILKYVNILDVPKETLDGICDALSIIFGFIGLYFAGKGTWPANPSNKVGLIILLTTCLSLSACAGLQQSWDKLTPDQQARIIINGLQSNLTAKFEQAKVYVDLNPQYKPVWKGKIVPAFDEANQTLRGMTLLLSGAKLKPEEVYIKIKPKLDQILLYLIEIGLEKK